MKISRYLIPVFIVIMMLSSFPFSSGDDQIDNEVPEVGSSYQPFSIDSDSELESMAGLEGWSGSGTEADPYVIEDLEIDGGSKNLGIYIGNTTHHMSISNVNISDVKDSNPGRNGIGIHLNNATNITLNGLNCSRNDIGLKLMFCSLININDSLFHKNGHGITISGSRNVMISNSNISVNIGYGARLNGFDLNIINCTIITNGISGVSIDTLDTYKISYSNVSNNGWSQALNCGGIMADHYVTRGGIIDNNTLIDNLNYGIRIRSGDGFDKTGKTILENNTIINCTQGAYIERFIIFKENSLHHGVLGVVSDTSSVISDNEISDFQKGVYVGSGCIVSGNLVQNTTHYGISGSDVKILSNTILNSMGNGIHLLSNVYHWQETIVDNNLIDSCRENGIYADTRNALIRYNVISNCNVSGISLKGSNITLLENIISDCSDDGVYIQNSSRIQLLKDHIYENGGNGVTCYFTSFLTMDDIDVHDNNGVGLQIQNSGEIVIRDSTFSYHDNDNIVISSLGDVTLEDVSSFASNSGGWFDVNGLLKITGSFFFSLDVGFTCREAGMVRMWMNMFQDCGPYFSSDRGPGYFNYSRLDMDTSNLVNGRKAYLVNSSFVGFQIPTDAGLLIIDSKDDMILNGIDMSDSTIGLIATGSSRLSISNCDFGNDLIGALIVNSNGAAIRTSSFNNCELGVSLGNITGGVIKDNSFLRGTYVSLSVDEDTSQLDISSNLFFSNTHITGYAIRILGYNCTIWENMFIYNRGTGDDNVSYLRQVYNDGNNMFFKNRRGNYWRDLHYPDIDNDGIVEAGYTMEGDSIIIDPYPLSACPLFEPPVLEVTGSFLDVSNILTWTEPDLQGLSEITGYNIYRRIYPGNLELIAFRSSFQNIYIDTNVEPGIDYRYSITAVNELVESDYSMEVRGLMDFFLPTLYILDPTQGDVYGVDSVRANWIGVDNQSGINHYEVRLDLGEWIDTGLTTTHLFFDLNEGTHIIKVKAVDNAGGETIEQVQFLIDMGIPSVNIIEPYNDQILSENITTIYWEATDDLSAIHHYEYSMDKGPWITENTSTSANLINLSQGDHNFEIIAYDLGGNFAIDRVNFTVDSVAPEVMIITPYSGLLTGSRDVRIEWDSIDIGTGIFTYLFKLDDQDWIDVGLRENRMLWQMEDGIHNVFVLARDLAGNEAFDNVSFTIDGTPPELAITSPSDGSHVSQSPVNVQWIATDAISGIDRMEFRDNESDWSEVTTNSYSMFNLEEDTYSVWVRVHDKVGNFITDSATFTVDRTDPEILGYGPLGDDVQLDEPIFVSFSEVMSQFNLRIVVTDTEGSIVWKGDRAVFETRNELEPGTQYNISVSGTDLAGNQLEPLEWTFNTTIYGRVRGRIIDEKGLSVQDAKITIGPKEVKSRPDGGFFIELENGTYQLRISKDGYSTKKMDANITAGRILELDEIILKDEEDRSFNIFACLLVPAAILLMVILAAIGGTLLTRHGRAALIEE